MLEDVKKAIAPHLLEFNNAYQDAVKSDISLLNDITTYIKTTSGKQIRPVFTYLSALLCGKVTPQTTRTALAMELLHTSTLVHDDVVDNSPMRRGKSTVNKMWNNKLAVLSGDYLLSIVLNILSANNDIETIAILSKVAAELSEGEVLQQEMSMRQDYSEEGYYEIIRKKTAALFSACFEAGAISAEADTEQIALLKGLGENIGIAFQIKDDILDYSAKIDAGKVYGNDIRERKFTLPLIEYMRKASPAEKEYILHVFEEKDMVTDEQVNEIVEKVNRSGGVDFAYAEMKRFIDKAIQDLDSFEPSEIKTALQTAILSL